MQQADFTIMKDTIEEEEESQSQSDSIFDKKRATATTTYSWLTQEEEEEPAAIKSSSSSCSSSCSLQPKQRRETISDIFQSKKRLFSNLHEKNKLSSFVSDELESTRHWDPHIDAFEILRAKITGITRSMQDFHVQELIQDELVAEERRKRLSVFPTTTISTPLQNNNSNKATSRRFSLATPKNEEKRFLNEDDKASISSDEEEEEERLPISSNITALFLTTNNLINSRLNELSETITSSNKSEQLKWQKQFLNLVTSCIHQSEALESLSTEILNAEHRVRELLLVKDSLHEQFQEREKQYEERIRECQEIAHQQLVMIDSLEELNADIDMKLETNRRELHRQEALNALDGRRGQEEEQEDQRWDFNKSVASLLHMEEKQDIIHKMRWEIGMFVGGGVGTGHIIHTVENELNGIDMMIAGTGSTSTSPNDHVRNSPFNKFLLVFLMLFYISLKLLFHPISNT